MTTHLVDASVSVRGEHVLLTFDVDGELPMHVGHWLLSTTFVAGPDGPIRQLGFKHVDGDLAAVFSFDHVDVGQRNYSDVTPQRVGARWTVRFPVEALGGVRVGRWHADLDVNGQDAGQVLGELSE